MNSKQQIKNTETYLKSARKYFNIANSEINKAIEQLYRIGVGEEWQGQFSPDGDIEFYVTGNSLSYDDELCTYSLKEVLQINGIIK